MKNGLLSVTIFVSLLTFPGQIFGSDGTDPENGLSYLTSAAEPSPAPPAAAPVIKGAPAAPSAGVPAIPAKVAGGPPASPAKEPDLVLAPGEVDTRVSDQPDAETEEGIADAFFDNALVEIGKGDDGLYAGLTDRIENNLRYFQSRGRDRFEMWLSRSGRYTTLMRGILEEYGLPGDLVYLALIESGFSPKAYSVARASGPWQFISGTARRYGLRVDWWIDERRDFEKSTRAAASYLRDLYGMFDSWPLAAAAYNAGEAKIMRAVARYKTDDFAKLIRHRYLARETKDYVPKMLAAMSIAKEPEKYGFDGIRYEEPIEFEWAVVPGSTDVAVMERIVGLPDNALRDLNPELRRFCTPPTRDIYEMRVPKGYGPAVGERMEEIRKEAKVTFLLHQVKKGETLGSIAKTYGTPESVLKEMNALKRSAVPKKGRMIIPVTGLPDEEAVPGKEVSPAQLTMAHLRVEEGKIRRRHRSSVGRRIVVHRGDTLEGIAGENGVSVQDLARANGLRADARIRAGSKLRLPKEGTRPVRKRGPVSSGGPAKTRSGV